MTHTDFSEFPDFLDRPTTPEDDDLDLLLGDASGFAITKDLGKLNPAIVLSRTKAPLEVVRRLSDVEISAIQEAQAGRRLNADPTDRQRWVFKDMQTYDTVCIAAERASKAQAAVHTYSQRTGRKFTTKRHADKSLQVTRIS
jgi:hypothetical protein